jgi:hypothetical protein
MSDTTSGTTQPVEPHVAAKLSLRTVPLTTFGEDKLGRKPCADMITELIEGTDGSLVIGLNGAWGTGKTTFLKMWQNDLPPETYQTIYYNAWEDDYCKDPLIAIIGQLWEKLKGTDCKEIIESIKKCAGPLLKKYTLGHLGLDCEDVMSSAENMVDVYVNEKKDIATLKGKIVELTDKLAGQGRHLIFFIDELDRCRPTFAIELLERVKHLFDIDGIYFVLGIDREQLGHSIKSVYGQGMDVDGYLKRFIDIEFSLPQANNSIFLKHVFEQYGINRISDERAEKSQRLDDRTALEKMFVGLSKCFNMSLRDIEHYCRLLSVLYTNTSEKQLVFPFFTAIMLFLRLYNKNLYQQYMEGNATGSDIVKFIASKPMGKEFLCHSEGILGEAYLLAGSPEEWLHEVIKNIRNALGESGKVPMPKDLLWDTGEKRLKTLLDRLTNEVLGGMHSFDHNRLAYISKKIDLMSETMLKKVR